MAESKSLRKPQKLLLDSNAAAAAAAQQLLQLSESDEDSSSERSKEESVRAVIEEIFGKEDQEIMYRPKKRRYRSLDSLYRATKTGAVYMFRKKLR